MYIFRYCHGKRPISMYSTGNSMLFMFRTDCCFEGKGFSATFTLVDEGMQIHFNCINVHHLTFVGKKRYLI